MKVPPMPYLVLLGLKGTACQKRKKRLAAAPYLSLHRNLADRLRAHPHSNSFLYTNEGCSRDGSQWTFTGQGYAGMDGQVLRGVASLRNGGEHILTGVEPDSVHHSYCSPIMLNCWTSQHADCAVSC